MLARRPARIDRTDRTDRIDRTDRTFEGVQVCKLYASPMTTCMNACMTDCSVHRRRRIDAAVYLHSSSAARQVGSTRACMQRRRR
jgi:hypothetical protein